MNVIYNVHHTFNRCKTGNVLGRKSLSDHIDAKNLRPQKEDDRESWAMSSENLTKLAQQTELQLYSGPPRSSRTRENTGRSFA